MTDPTEARKIAHKLESCVALDSQDAADFVNEAIPIIQRAIAAAEERARTEERGKAKRLIRIGNEMQKILDGLNPCDFQSDQWDAARRELEGRE